MSLAVPEIGATFAGRYRVLRLLGRGGMGVVFAAEQLTTGALRALKLMHRERCADERLVRMFQQEARIGHRIASDHVVQVLDAGVDEVTGMPWMAMELLDGEHLGARVDREGALPRAQAGEILGQVGHALAAAHAIGIVHRDLKPENVFLAVSRRQGAPLFVKLLDFGIAKVVAESRPQGTVIGTPLWMAPEQLTGDPVSAATDVWALGLLAFWMLTGRVYWMRAGGRIGHLLDVLAENEPRLPASARAGCAAPLPADFDAWFARCTEVEPAARFADAGAACEALRGVLDIGQPIVPVEEEVMLQYVPHTSTQTLPGRGPAQGPARPEHFREVLHWLRRSDCTGVALLAPLGYEAHRIAADVLEALKGPGEPLFPIRLVPERQATSERGFYERLLRDLRWGLPPPWRTVVDGHAEVSAMDRFEFAVEDLLVGPVATEERTLLFVVEGLAQASTSQLERWGYLMARLSGRGLKLLVWGGQELQELRTRPASGSRFSAFHVLRGIWVGTLSTSEVRALAAARLGDAAVAVVHEQTGGHPVLVRELVEAYAAEARAGDRAAIAARLLASDHLARLRRAVAADPEAQEVLRALAAAEERPLPRGRRPAEERLRWLGVLREAGATGWDWTAPVMQRFAAEW